MQATHNRLRALFTVLTVFILGTATCQAKGQKSPASTSAVTTIATLDEFKEIVASSGDQLLIFDLYADWCMPCKLLSPILEEIAREHRDKVRVYKVNVDKNPQIAGGLGVTGIPYVVFVKNQTGVHAMTGVHPKAAYVRAITVLVGMDSEEGGDTPDGKIVDGVREIRITTATSPGNIYVYRGETVKIIVEKVSFPYSIHIPQFNVSGEATVGKDLEVTFKAKDIGSFPMFCNGQCPSGDGARYGQIIVMQYEARGEAIFKEVDVAGAKELMAKGSVLILDVRTPNEYYRGRIKGARLIPVQQLQSRWKEIEAYKDKDILVYCRSGNRSTVASEILIEHGFKKLHNLRHGVIGWKKAGEKLVTN